MASKAPAKPSVSKAPAAGCASCGEDAPAKSVAFVAEVGTVDVMPKTPAAPDEAAPTDQVACHACALPLRPAFELPDQGGPERYQFDNALWLTFDGGYSMFIDDPIDGPGPRVAICHDCAHALCAAVPWIGALLDPARSHAHRSQFWADNPDHDGWDTPKRCQPAYPCDPGPGC